MYDGIVLYLGVGCFVVVGLYLGVGLGDGATVVVVVGSASVGVVVFFMVNP